MNCNEDQSITLRRVPTKEKPLRSFCGDFQLDRKVPFSFVSVVPRLIGKWRPQPENEKAIRSNWVGGYKVIDPIK